MSAFNSTFARVSVLFLAVSACTSEPAIRPISIDRVRRSCSLEAEQLVKSVVSYEQPVVSQSGASVLESGRFIYRCEKRTEWMAVMYPRVGEKVDCQYREGEQQCPMGWIKEELTTYRFD